MKKNFLILTVILFFSAGCVVQQYRIINNELHIFLKNKEAQQVYFLHSLDEYAPHEAIRDESGLWISILPSDVEFKYFYIIDGKVFIPDCRIREKDDFGSENCVYIPLLGMP